MDPRYRLDFILNPEDLPVIIPWNPRGLAIAATQHETQLEMVETQILNEPCIKLESDE